MAASQVESSYRVEIAPQLHQYVPAALLRLQFQYPSLTFARSDEGVVVDLAGDDARIELRRDILHTVYREKIYAETLPLRRRLIEAVTAR